MLKRKSSIAAGVLAASLLFAACGGGNKEGASDTTVPTTDSVPEVVIDEEIKNQLDVEPGSAVIPGSIESVAQELGDACTKAVAPLRDLMKKYPSLRQVPPDGPYQDAMTEGRKCQEANPQEWADFYTKELAGWIYAKTEK